MAPDGSLIVADWHDPGVGGHGDGRHREGTDLPDRPARARTGRCRPADFDTVAGAVAALESPNSCTRATALERLAREPEAAAAPLAAAFAAASDPRLKAGMPWAAGMLPGQAEAWIARLAADPSADLRIVAVRMCRL